MSQVKELVAQLTPPQQAAIRLLKLALDCFNSADGTGLFSGPERYNALAGRVEIAAVQADNLPRFWALLLRRMLWPVPPCWADSRIVEALSAQQGTAVLRVLASETVSCVTLARMLHAADKEQLRADRQDLQREAEALVRSQ